MNIRKIIMFTDTHFGARNNSDEHNTDLLYYFDWFCDIVKKEKPSHIAFLGDYFENRAQLNVKTLNYAFEGARKLNALNLPVIFIIGNHDLYHRSDRTIFSTDIFDDLKNFTLVSEPIELSKDWFVSPFLFKQEYPELVQDINSHKYVLGHFEFKNFVLTGSDQLMEHGPDIDAFKGPKYIFSGHYHKRQIQKNVIYIGNSFPTNFGDASDKERGCAVFDVQKNDVYFYNWEEAPLFFKTRLSRIIGGDYSFPPKSRVRCLLDMDIGYSEVQALRNEILIESNLREFSVQDDNIAKQELLNNGLEIQEDDLSSLNDTVRQLIMEGVNSTSTINAEMLVNIYEELV